VSLAIPTRLRVLLVEDSPLVAARLGEVIRQLPDVELIGIADCQADAESALARESPDVMLLDLCLRQGTGFGVLRAQRDSDHRPTTVVLTNYSLPDYRRTAEALGARWFLDKAADSERLPQILSALAALKLAAAAAEHH
jgi:two-component system, OmpR family, response regulator